MVAITTLFPPELLVHFFSFLPPEDLCKARLICKLFDRVARENILWRPFVKNALIQEERSPFESLLRYKLKMGNYSRVVVEGTCKQYLLSKELCERSSQDAGKKVLATLEKKKHLGIWDSQTWELIGRIPTKDAFKMYLEETKVFLLKKDAASRQRKVIAYDFETGNEIEMQPHTKILPRSIIGASYNKLFIVNPNGKIIACDANSGEELWNKHAESAENANAIRLSKNYLVRMLTSHEIVIYDTENGEKLGNISVDEKIIAFELKDDKLVIQTYENRNIEGYIYEISKSAEVKIKSTLLVTYINFNFDSDLTFYKNPISAQIVCSGSKVFMINQFQSGQGHDTAAFAGAFDIETGKSLYSIQGYFTSITAFNVIGNVSFAIEKKKQCINFWELETGKFLKAEKLDDIELKFSRVIGDQILLGNGNANLVINYTADEGLQNSIKKDALQPPLKKEDGAVFSIAKGCLIS